MARLRPLFHYALVSNRRAFALKRSAMARGFEYGLAFVIAYAFCKQLWSVMTGPGSARLAVAKPLVFILGALWVLLPLSSSPAFSAQQLAGYPLSRRQQGVYRLLSHWLDWKAAALLIASLACVIALAWTPRGLLHMALAMGLMLVGGICGTALAIAATQLQTCNGEAAKGRRALKMRSNPLFRKELTYYARTLDPYAALLIAMVAGYTELAAQWMTPIKATIPLLLISVTLLMAVLNPFALDAQTERDRYRSLPLSFARILANKHAALAVIFLVSESPLVAALLWQLPWLDGFAVLAELAVILVSYLLTGLVLMRTPSAGNIRIRMGSFSGQGITLELYTQAIAMNALFPLAVLFLARGRLPLLHVAIPLAMFVALSALYLWLLRRQNWFPTE
jgi:hypothetical protein